MIKTKEIRVCDFCTKELEGDFIHTEGVENEGCSTIWHGEPYSSDAKSCGVGEQDFCDIGCLTNQIEKDLGLK